MNKAQEILNIIAKTKTRQSKFDSFRVAEAFLLIEQSVKEMDAEISALKKELKTTDHLLEQSNRVLNAIPECPMHGACIPNALEWIKKAKKAMELQEADEKTDCSVDGNKERSLVDLSEEFKKSRNL